MARFKVEIEVDVEYGKVAGVATEPYTSFTGYVDKNQLAIVTTCGKIKDFNIKKVERKIKEEN